MPVKLKDFSGKALAEYNLLSWNAEALAGIESSSLQKSNDGINFIDIASFRSLRDMERNDYKDLSPFAKTFYRLAFKNTSQQVEYSSVVLLQRENKNVITVYPNPAKDQINVQLNSTGSATYLFKLYNNIGQLVLSKVKKTDIQQITLPLKGVAKGVYQLTVIVNNGSAETHRVIVQ